MPHHFFTAPLRQCSSRILSILKFTSLTLILLLPATLTHGGSFMGILKKDTGVIFSDFSGQLLYNGEPAAGAQIRRTYELFGKKGEDSVVADEQGRFQFEAVIWKFREPLLSPVGFMVDQEIFVHFNDKGIPIWGGVKVDPVNYYEFNGEPKNLYCELTDKEIRRVDTSTDGFVGTMCQWDK